MQYVFFAAFVLNVAVALFALSAILRVSFGKASFNTGGAAVFNLALLAACSTCALWSFNQAFAA